MSQSLSGTLNVMLCIALFLIIYGIIGVQIFKDEPPPVKFSTFPDAMLSLFQVITGEGWVDIMHSAMEGSRSAAPAYFISYYVVVNFVLLNIIVAIIVANFELQEDEKLRKQSENFQQRADRFANRTKHRQSFSVRRLAKLRPKSAPSSGAEAALAEPPRAASPDAELPLEPDAELPRANPMPKMARGDAAIVLLADKGKAGFENAARNIDLSFLLDTTGDLMSGADETAGMVSNAYVRSFAAACLN